MDMVFLKMLLDIPGNLPASGSFSPMPPSKGSAVTSLPIARVG